MEEIANDPIISFYMKMSNPTDSEKEMPLFSETMLRLSFKQVFGSMRPISPIEIELYRKLLLFNYSENFTSITDLLAIMTCFDEEQVRECFDKHESIIDEWHKFLRAFLFPILYREALNEILYEYANRHFILYGKIDEDKVKRKALEVLEFLRFDNRLPKQWFRVFSSLVESRSKNPDKNRDQDKNVSIDDLEIPNIYLDVKDRLNILIVEEIAKSDRKMFQGVKEPPVKKYKRTKPKEVNIIKVELLPSMKHYDHMKTSEGTENSENHDAEYDESHEIDSEIKSVPNSADFNDEIEAEIRQEILQQVVILNGDNDDDDDNDDVVDVDNDNDDDNENESEHRFNKTRLSATEEHNDEDLDENYKDNDFEENHDDANSTTSDFSNANGDEEDDGKSGQSGILDKDQALSYIAALQAYVVVNGHFEAIELLDKVDSLLRKN